MALFKLKNDHPLSRHFKRTRTHRGKHAIVKRDGEFLVRGLNTGRILGRHKTYIEALNQLRAVERLMHGR